MKKIFLIIVSLWIVIWISPKIYSLIQKGALMNETIIMVIDEDIKDFNERLGSYFKGSTHETGLKFLKLDLDEKSNSIELKAEDSSVVFDSPLGIRVVVDEINKINDFSFSLGLDSQRKMSHDDAIKKMYLLLKQITDAGWRRYISRSSPRICGEEVLTYRKSNFGQGYMVLDDTYQMTLEEWLSMSTYSWSFYYKNIGFMDLNLHREGLNSSIIGNDAYFLEVQISSVENSERENYRKKEDKDNWKVLVGKNLKREENQRIEREEKAIKDGFHICTEYMDCPISRGVLPGEKDTGEDNISENITCTKTGYWQSYVASSEALPQLTKREGTILFYNAGVVFLEKDEELSKINNLLRWRFLGSNDEFDLIEGKLIKKIENERGERISLFSNAESCPKTGYWQSFQESLNSKEVVAYFKQGEALTLNSNDPLTLLLKWKYIGDENEFEVVSGKLVKKS